MSLNKMAAVRTTCLYVQKFCLLPHWSDFDETWYLNFTRKSAEKIKVFLKSDKNNRWFTWTHFYIYENISLNYSYILHQVVEKIETHFMFYNPLTAHKIVAWKKYSTARQTRDNIRWRMRFACCIPMPLPPPPSTHTHTQICNIYCFFTATIVTRTTLYVHCLSR